MPSPLVYLTCVIALGVAAQWVAWRLKFPAILLLLGTGFVLGRWVAPDELVPPSLLAAGVSLSVAVILFEGGLSLKFRDLGEAGPAIVRLVTVGCLVTWGAATALGRLLVFDTLAVAALAGAIYTVTGPTVIGPLLRHVRPHRRPAAVARWEGIVNDPIGALLAVLVYEAIQAQGPEAAAATVTLALGKTLAAAAVIGGGVAAAVVAALRRHWLPDYLHAPVLVAAVLAAFTLSDLVQHESGLATVTVLGIALANQRRVAIEHVTKFKEGLGVLLLGGLFIVLSGRLRPEDLAALGWEGALFVAAMILAVRPAATFVATARSALDRRERAFVAWMAPRGVVAAAVSGIFALQLDRLGPQALRADAGRIEPLTFLLIVATVAVYGLTAKPVARRLGVADPDPQGLLIIGAGELERAVAKAVHEEGYSVLLVDNNRENVTAARLDGLRTRHGNILSESLQEDLDLAGLGRLLAMTPSDKTNALAALAFVDTFERAGVFQLPASPAPTPAKAGGENRPMARRLFAPDATYAELARRLRAGALIKKTLLTEEFDFTAFRGRHGPRATVLFVVGRTGGLTVCTVEEPPSPVPGQKLIALIDPEPAATARTGDR
ncbi:MAG TPA: cation:proton antiporter [Planctomycetaceae bacterium]